MDLFKKYLDLAEAWPGTPEYKKKYDSTYNPYDPEGSMRKALKQRPYGYRGKAADSDNETPAATPSVAKRGRPKKMREEVEDLEEAQVHKVVKQKDGTHDVHVKTEFGEIKHIGTIHPPNSDGVRVAKYKDGTKVAMSKSVDDLAKRLSGYHGKHMREEVEDLEEKITVVPAGTPNTGIQRVKLPSGGTITTGTMARKPKPTPTSSPSGVRMRPNYAQTVLQRSRQQNTSLSSQRSESFNQLAELDAKPGGLVQRYLAKAAGPEGRQRRVKAAIEDPKKLERINKGIKGAEKRVSTAKDKFTKSFVGPHYKKQLTPQQIAQQQDDEREWWTRGT